MSRIFDKAKPKRKRGQPQGKLAAWLTNQTSFAFTAPLTLDECAERLSQDRVIERLQVANSWVHQKRAYSISQTRDDVDRLSFTVVERVPTGRSNEPTFIQYKIEGNIRSIDSQSVFVEGRISFFHIGYSIVLIVPILQGLLIAANQNLADIFRYRFNAFCLGVEWLGFSSFMLYQGLTTNHRIKTTRLALIRDILEAKQKFSQDEENESSDGNSTRSTSTSATL